MEQKTESRSQIWRIKTIAVGAAAGSFAAMAALAAFAAAAVAVGSFSAVAKIAPWVVWSVCGFFAGGSAALTGRRGPLPNGLVSAAIAALVLSLVSLSAQGEGGSLLFLLPCFSAGGLGSVAGMKLREKFIRKS
ncbi:MAG: hypothetical protein IKM29_01270 [Clostridia bacterium]|nr:hypothetical protein [Clostridia bacterium]